MYNICRKHTTNWKLLISMSKKKKQKYNGLHLVICVTYANIIYLKNTPVDKLTPTSYQ